MNKTEIQTELETIIERYGPWSAHNVDLGEGILTLPESPVPDLSTVVKIASDVARRPIADCRIVDLGCLEGMFSIAFAQAGAEVVGIEGRERNIEKARFASRVLELENIEFIQADVRDLSSDVHGKFDVVFCQGVLYHLDVPDVFTFVETMKSVCSAAVVLNTHFAPADLQATSFELGPLETVSYQNRQYTGRHFIEHGDEDSPEIKDSRVWASLDNSRSFWLTKESLLALLRSTGFRHIYVCHSYYHTMDRCTLIATVE